MDESSIRQAHPLMEQSSIAILSFRRKKLTMEEPLEMQPWYQTNTARRLIAVREALGLTKAQMADRLGYDRSSYTKLEKGEKQLLVQEVYKIYRLFGVDPNFFYLGLLGNVPASLSSKIADHLRGAKDSNV